MSYKSYQDGKIDREEHKDNVISDLIHGVGNPPADKEDAKDYWRGWRSNK